MDINPERYNHAAAKWRLCIQAFSKWIRLFFSLSEDLIFETRVAII